MPISADLIGTRLPGEDFTISADAVALFSVAVEQPLCAAEHEHVVPVTFPITALMGQMSAALLDAGVNWSRVVHGDQKFSYSRPLRVGDHLTGSTTIESVKAIAGNEIIGVRTDFADDDGAIVVSCMSTIVERGEKS